MGGNTRPDMDWGTTHPGDRYNPDNRYPPGMQPDNMYPGKIFNSLYLNISFNHV